MSIHDKKSRVNILGAGVMGLSLALEMLKDGYQDIHLFDKIDYSVQGYRYSDGCDSASSDLNKIFKTDYGDKVHYTEMAERSKKSFLDWNDEIEKSNWEGGEPIYIKTGFLSLDESDKAGDRIKFVEDGKSVPCSLSEDVGITVADKSCRWVLHLISKSNTNNQLKFHWGREVKLLTDDDKKAVGFQTDDLVNHLAPLNIVCAGPWVTKIIPEIDDKIETAAGTVSLIKIEDSDLHASLVDIPPWVYKCPNGGTVYGFPVSEGYLKIGYRGIKFTNRSVKTRWTKVKELNMPLIAVNEIKSFISQYIPQITKISCNRLCWHADTEDNELLVSYVPHYKNKSLFVITGDSGHAFKMLGSIGSYSLNILKGKGESHLTHKFSWERNRSGAQKVTKYEHTLEDTKMSTLNDLWILPRAKL